jgi:hypothetical protein
VLLLEPPAQSLPFAARDAFCLGFVLTGIFVLTSNVALVFTAVGAPAVWRFVIIHVR